MSEKETKELTLIEKSIKFAGLFLIVVAILANIFMGNELTLYNVGIPALMIGFKAENLFNLKE